LLLEEAHVVIGRNNGGGGNEQGNPKLVSTRMFTRAIAEMRALGEGIVIADQLPTAIAPEAVKNTSLKVMHRLVSADDRNELGQAMIFDAGQVEQAAMLSPGRAFVHMEGWARSRLVAEPDFKTVHKIAEPPEDSFITASMANIRELEPVRRAYLPYAGCENVCRTCSVRLREEIERACRGALAEMAEKTGDEEAGDPLTRAMEVFMMRARIPVPQEGDASDRLTAPLEGASAEDRIRFGCVGVFLTEVLLPQLH
jgi:hypothetical protein